MCEDEIDRLGTGKQYIIWGAILSLLVVLTVMTYHFFTYGWSIPFTEDEINTACGVPCFIALDLGILFILENAYF